jgi:hypothetical protein
MALSGLKLTIPKGRVAELKKNHLELAASVNGYTKSTGCILLAWPDRLILPRIVCITRTKNRVFFMLIGKFIEKWILLGKGYFMFERGYAS